MNSLRTKILTLYLIFFTFLSVAFVIYTMRASANYRLQLLESIENTVAFETEKVNKIIDMIELSAISLSREALLFFKSQSIELGELSALENLRGFPLAAGGGFWFEPYAYKKDLLRSGVYAFFDRTKGEARLDEFIMDDYDYHSLDWYRQIIDEVRKPHQVVWTRPYMDDTAFSYMTTAGAGIFDESGRIIGISNIDWEIEGVVRELSGIKPTENSFALLCAPEQDFVISSTRGSISGQSIKSLPWDTNAASFLLDGIKYLQFGRFMDNGWLLSIQIPEYEIYADIRRQNRRLSIIIGLSSIVMLCLVYVSFSVVVNKPLKQLTSEVSQLALGNLDVRVDVSSNDELGLLGQTFNKMTSDLKKSIEAYTREHAQIDRIAAELNVAAEMQASMLPNVFPPFPEKIEFDIYATMHPAKEVGGDFYDFFLIDENTLAVVIADVSGKGVPAALFMAITKILIKSNACSGKKPREVFDAVNNMLCENKDSAMFVTAFMGYYNLSNGSFIYVNAGHNPPLIKKSGNNYEFLTVKSCLVLACDKDYSYSEEEITLEPGDAIYFYTDGVTEAMNKDRELFSGRRLLEVLAKGKDYPPGELLSSVKREIDLFSDGAEQADDITMLALEILSYGETALLEEL